MAQKKFTIRIKCESEATQLWAELLRIINNDPYIAANEDDMAWYRCYFCKSDFDREHNEDCIYIKAKKMLKRLEKSKKKFVKAGIDSFDFDDSPEDAADDEVSYID